MKKISVSIALLLGITGLAGAQNMYDAMSFSKNNYYGTARSMALGNAVTALGGDLGTIGINPAGSAVNGYSQFTITDGLSISSLTTGYSVKGDEDYRGFSPYESRGLNKPNFGLTMCMETGSSTGLKWVTVGFVSNQTNNYRKFSFAEGSNPYTSRFGEFASACQGYNPAILGDYNSYYDTDISWDLLTAYGAGLFSNYGSNGGYVGNSQMIGKDDSFCYVPAGLNQSSFVSRTGTKSDIVLNVAGNWNDRLYIGFNLGIPSISNYEYNELYTERSEEPGRFPITFITDGKATETHFLEGTFDYRYTAEMDGVYAKLGVIYLPTDRLRLGAAYQTSTIYTIRENWKYDASSTFDVKSYNASSTSPTGDFTYCMRSPSILNLGVAYVLGSCGLVSVDYERMNYSRMRFTDVSYDAYGDEEFSFAKSPYVAENSANKLFCGKSHALRVGAELNLGPAFSLRAGMSLLTNPERHYTDSYGNDVTADMYLANYDDYKSGRIELGNASYYGDVERSFSLGLGYKSAGSFFADCAVRVTNYPDNYFSPYYDYDAFNSAGKLLDVSSPRVMETDVRMCDIVATLGWRF